MLTRAYVTIRASAGSAPVVSRSNAINLISQSSFSGLSRGASVVVPAMAAFTSTHTPASGVHLRSRRAHRLGTRRCSGSQTAHLLPLWNIALAVLLARGPSTTRAHFTYAAAGSFA